MAGRVSHTDLLMAYIPVWGKGVGIAMVLILQLEKYTFGIFYTIYSHKMGQLKDIVLWHGLS